MMVNSAWSARAALKRLGFFVFVSATLVSCTSRPLAVQTQELPENEDVRESVSLDDSSVDSETADTELVDDSPEDLGKIQASDQRSESEVLADKLARKTFPLVQNEFVDQWINYFTGRGRRHFEVYLSRSTRYISMMKKTLKEDGLPEDLIYLAMIESGFNTKARSRAKAVGPWQFIKGTGQRYGMEVDYWVDERRDFIKSTHAAAQYLKELHQIFGTWYLAAASYNAGEGRVLNAVRRSKTRDFWELARVKANFRSETRNYVPKMIAAALISKSPEKYGFNEIAYEKPLVWDLVKVPGGVSLRSVAKANNLDIEELKLLNPELVRAITPASEKTYEVRVPSGTAEKVLANLNVLNREASDAFVIHRVRKGQTLGAIARQYGSSVDVIMDFNNIRKATAVRVGMNLRIPVDEDRASGRSRRQGKLKSIRERNPSSADSSNLTRIKIRSGDSWWSLARHHGLSVQKLKNANRSTKKLMAGLYLNIPKDD